MLETELAARVIAWLRDLRWEVYQEVQMQTYGPRADIVAVQNGIIWVIETKLSFGSEVLGQAFGWYGFSHYISAATFEDRSGRKREANRASRRVCTDYAQWRGIGWLLVTPHEIYEKMTPRLNRQISSYLKDALCDAQKSFAEAGNAQGKRWSPFQGTCQEILRFVTENPGTDLKTMLERIETHYSSSATARSCIAHWAEKGIIPGIRSKIENRKWRLYPIENRVDTERNRKLDIISDGVDGDLM
jgi:hypothetical protein